MLATGKAPRYSKILATTIQAEADQSEEDLVITEEPLPAFPKFTGTMADLAGALCPDLPYCHKFMAGLTLVGGLLSGTVHMADAPHVDPRFYTVLIDPKGAGKGGACNEVRAALRPILNGVNIAVSLDSGPALVLEVKMHPKTLLFSDELPALFEKAKITGASRNSLFSEMLTLHDGHETANTAKANFDLPKNIRNQVCDSGGAGIRVTDAQFCMLGCAQPETFQAMWRGTKAGTSGLQSRFVLASSGQTAVPEPQRPSDQTAVDQAVVALTAQLQPYLTAARNTQFIQLPDELGQQLRAWWSERGKNPKASTRLPAILMRLLIVLAVTNGVTTVTPELVEQALAFGEYQIDLASRFMPMDAVTWDQEFARYIRVAFERHGPYLTLRQVRQYVNPEQHTMLGGYRPFMIAWDTLRQAGVVYQVDKTRKGAGIFAYDGVSENCRTVVTT